MGAFLDKLRIEQAAQRPVARRIAELFDDIEQALAEGFSREQIVAGLKAEGIDITPGVLSNYLVRLRVRRAAGVALASPEPHPPATPAVTTPVPLGRRPANARPLSSPHKARRSNSTRKDPP